MSTNKNNNKNHLYFMRLALQQARIVLGNTKTNPSVGCVITKKNNVIAVGHTSINGRPHAEVNAITLSKEKLNNSSLYVTLEPCSHYGKTPPCVNLIIKKKINKVFFSIKDPDQRSYDKSSKKLRNYKIKVFKNVLNKEAINFYDSYIKQKKNDLPFVTSKLALSKDLYSIDRKKKWITNKYSRGRVHLMRAQNDCIITSSSTVANDNPALTCRIKGLESLTPARVILDRELKVSIKSKIFSLCRKAPVIIFYNTVNKKKIKIFKKRKIRTFKVPLNITNNLDLLVILKKIKRLGFSRIFLETGIKLNHSFLKENLINEFHIFFSNKMLKKRGKNNIKKYFNQFIKNKGNYNVRVNLFDDKLISYKIK